MNQLKLMPYKDLEVRKRKHKEYSREHYLANQKETKQRTKENKALLKKEWFAFKGTLKCSKCEFNHIAALDFHHEDPSTKEGNVHGFISNGQFAKAYEEIKKCIVLCANCHRIHHHEEKKKFPERE
jgi:hypothetical protein